MKVNQTTTDKNTQMAAAEWFENWFDSPYYHILYKTRDESEAEGFIDQLLETLSPPAGARILDLACGKGRYSRHLASHGFEVTGIDLSVQSITFARQYEQDNLSFFTHDMRQPFRINYFDYIFNFFTSFGYFDSEKDDIRTLRNVAAGLRPGGTFVLDFFNSVYVINRLTGSEEKVIDGILFKIHKKVEGQHVIKTIDFRDHGKTRHFEERVRLFLPEDFERLFGAAGLRILKTYGDYQLRPFHREESPRLILVAQPMH
ncbi:MAG: methyltransferase domain-containing protein [Phaeodactylibacter sp.]|nr:methyltransferase domain-containing protein [Phaeodactylibacter sp.]